MNWKRASLLGYLDVLLSAICILVKEDRDEDEVQILRYGTRISTTCGAMWVISRCIDLGVGRIIDTH